MTYIVMIAIKNVWWSDHKPFVKFVEAQRHRRTVAEKWNDCDTAISSSDGRTLAFLESAQERARVFA